MADFQLDFAASTAGAKWFFVPDDDLLDRIKDLEEEESVHYYDSDSDRAETVELYDSADEDGPLLERKDGHNQFRTMPNPETIPDFLVDAARIVESSTRLRKCILRHRHSWQRDMIYWDPGELIPYGRHFELWYLRSGTQCNHDKHNIPADESFVMIDRIYWRVGDRWRPDARVVDAWRRAVGSEVMYCFLKDFYDYNGRRMSWQSTRDLQGKQYAGEVDWEDPGQDVSLELNELKEPFERGITVYGPRAEDSIFNWY